MGIDPFYWVFLLGKKSCGKMERGGKAEGGKGARERRKGEGGERKEGEGGKRRREWLL